MKQHTFLVEIGTEELPPKTLRTLAETFAFQIGNQLDTLNIHYREVKWFATPRRLAVQITDLSSKQPDRYLEKRGPTIQQAFDNFGHPTQVAECWARSRGIKVSQAKRFKNNRGTWLMSRSLIKGQPVQKLLFEIINHVLNTLPIIKKMFWGDHAIPFIRPVHTVTLLFDHHIVSGSVLGINVDRILLGHRFMGEQKIKLKHADQYLPILFKKGLVMADYLQRKEIIRQNVETTAKQLGGVIDLSENLLEEVTSLVEWPVILTASFKKKFLVIPSEALIHIMQKDQKYFPVYDSTGTIIPHFIFVANIESKDPKQIITGNEKVIHSRLSDAEFFFNQDRKLRLKDRLLGLNTLIFHKQLGTMYDKSNRMEILAAWIAEQIGADISNSMRASLLSKCDLISHMVFEFPEIQGVMGMHYARYDGEEVEVALAIKEHYYPRFSGDILPTKLVSCVVAIADKIDTLVGIFGISQSIKGDKDPFALRRAALGVLRIIIEKQLPIDLQNLTKEVVRAYGKKLTNNLVVNDVMNFFFCRLRAWYQEKGYSTDILQAVLVRRPTSPIDFDARIRALSHFCTLKAAASLTMANKRISKILAKSNNLIIKEDFQVSLLKEPAEIRLANFLATLRNKLPPLLKAGYYDDVLIELATLNEPVDSFFKSVMVMTDNYQLQINRLKLLIQLRHLFLQVADVTLLQ